MRALGLLCALGVAACAPQPAPIVQGDPTATAALFALSDARFAAQTQLAQQVANACPRLGFNQRFAQGLSAQHGGGAAANIPAIELERDVATRSLQARYDVTFGQDNLCAVGEGEIARQSALSAVLVRI